MRNNWQSMRERIVKESATLFLHKGFQGTTIKDITDAVGLTKGAFYWYFKTKDELLETILEEWEKTFLEGLIASDGASVGTFLDRFKRYHKYSTEYAVRHRELCLAWTILAAEIAGSGIKAERRFRDGLDRYIGFVKGLIEAGKAEHVVKADFDSSVLADTIIAMHNGVLLQWYIRGADVEGPQLARAFRNVLLSGITIAGA